MPAWMVIARIVVGYLLHLMISCRDGIFAVAATALRIDKAAREFWIRGRVRCHEHAERKSRTSCNIAGGEGSQLIFFWTASRDCRMVRSNCGRLKCMFSSCGSSAAADAKIPLSPLQAGISLDPVASRRLKNDAVHGGSRRRPGHLPTRYILLNLSFHFAAHRNPSFYGSSTSAILFNIAAVVNGLGTLLPMSSSSNPLVCLTLLRVIDSKVASSVKLVTICTSSCI